MKKLWLIILKLFGRKIKVEDLPDVRIVAVPTLVRHPAIPSRYGKVYVESGRIAVPVHKDRIGDFVDRLKNFRILHASHDWSSGLPDATQKQSTIPIKALNRKLPNARI